MKARDIMIPISDCPRVAEHRTLYDAVVMLEAWRQRHRELDYRLRVVLVYDANHRIIGHLRAIDFLRALSALRPSSSEPNQAAEPSAATSFDKQAAHWADILAHLHEASHRVTVKDAMHRYRDVDFIDELAPLEEVLSRLLDGPCLDLVVTSENTATGIVRLSDVFSMVCRYIEKSGLK